MILTRNQFFLILFMIFLSIFFLPESLVPAYDAESCETNVPGLYVAGTVQAGVETNRVFIENSRDHGDRIVRHLLGTRERAGSGNAPS